jgi:hypothetical protein
MYEPPISQADIQEYFMNWLKECKLSRLVPVAAFFLSWPAMAQFEVSPDHFDATAKNETVHKPSPNKTTSRGRPSSASASSQATAGEVAQIQLKQRTTRRRHAKTDGARASAADRGRSVGKHDASSNVAKAILR